MPPAPARLSTTNCCPRLSLMRCETSLAIVSGSPPAGYGTTTRTGFEGYCCAHARAAHMTMSGNNPKRARKVPIDSYNTGMAPDELIDDLVVANHILYNEGVVDGFGHISVRHPERPERFLLSRSLAPAVVQHADIMEHDLDGEPVDANGRRPYLERFIHSEIYRARADVQAIVHSHSPSIIPYTVTGAALKPVYHMSGFLAFGVPTF